MSELAIRTPVKFSSLLDIYPLGRLSEVASSFRVEFAATGSLPFRAALASFHSVPMGSADLYAFVPPGEKCELIYFGEPADDAAILAAVTEVVPDFECFDWRIVSEHRFAQMVMNHHFTIPARSLMLSSNPNEGWNDPFQGLRDIQEHSYRIFTSFWPGRAKTKTEAYWQKILALLAYVHTIVTAGLRREELKLQQIPDDLVNLLKELDQQAPFALVPVTESEKRLHQDCENLLSIITASAFADDSYAYIFKRFRLTTISSMSRVYSCEKFHAFTHQVQLTTTRELHRVPTFTLIWSDSQDTRLEDVKTVVGREAAVRFKSAIGKRVHVYETPPDSEYDNRRLVLAFCSFKIIWPAAESLCDSLPIYLVTWVPDFVGTEGDDGFGVLAFASGDPSIWSPPYSITTVSFRSIKGHPYKRVNARLDLREIAEHLTVFSTPHRHLGDEIDALIDIALVRG